MGVDRGVTTTNWKRSANPTPLCRRGGCPEPAIADDEWCERHAALVNRMRDKAPVNKGGRHR